MPAFAPFFQGGGAVGGDVGLIAEGRQLHRQDGLVGDVVLRHQHAGAVQFRRLGCGSGRTRRATAVGR
jgi:hypothetical protein